MFRIDTKVFYCLLTFFIKKDATKFVKSGFIRLRATVVNGSIELSVEDSGPGVPEEMRSLLFQKYQTSLDVISQGNGIGLALCRNLVMLLNGDIWLEESYDSGIPGSPGARFVVQLNTPPLVQNTASPMEGGDASTESVSNGTEANPLSPGVEKAPHLSLPETLSVLFVDDDSVLRKLFMRSLQNLCPTWVIEGASSGEAALELISGAAVEGGDIEQHARSLARHFDLLFVDHYMGDSEPRLLGTETVAEMRARGIKSTICGLSANDMECEFVAAGADFFVLKPLPCRKAALEAKLLRITQHIREDKGRI